MSNSADVLLSPSESNAFSSFLAALDKLDPKASSGPGLSAEWNMYSNALSHHIQIPNEREQLARATQDLIGFANAPNLRSQPPTPQPPLSASVPRFPAQDLRASPQYIHGASQWPGMTPVMPNYGGSHFNPPQPGYGSGPSSSAILPQTTMNPQSMMSRPPLSNIWTSTPMPSSHSSSSAITLTSSSSSSSSSITPVTSSLKRHSYDNHEPGFLLTEQFSTSPVSSKRFRYSPESNQSIAGPSGSNIRRDSTSMAQIETSSSSPSSSSKPALLSANQKKLNHIQSEQKRRANIRKGYDALCDVVPALREAIKAEDAECANTGRKRGRGKLLGEEGEKLDGRAGPRSESVVLQKTVEHMTDLIDTRDALLERLRAAQGALPQGHPALIYGPPDRPWERTWNGGIGLPLDWTFDQDEDEEGGSDDGGD